MQERQGTKPRAPGSFLSSQAMISTDPSSLARLGLLRRRPIRSGLGATAFGHQRGSPSPTRTQTAGTIQRAGLMRLTWTQYAAAKYYRRAEAAGSKTLGNSW
jgi:hypothetical protein